MRFNFLKFKLAGTGNARQLREDLTDEELDDAYMKPYDPKEKYPGRINQNQQFDVSWDGPNDGGVDAELPRIKEEFDKARTEMLFDPSNQFQISTPSSAPMMDSSDVGIINPAIGTAAETARKIDPNDPDNIDNDKRLPNGQTKLPMKKKRLAFNYISNIGHNPKAASRKDLANHFENNSRCQYISPLEKAWKIQKWSKF